MQSFRHIGLKLWKIGAIQNWYPIVVYGVMSDSGSKNPRPMLDQDHRSTAVFILPTRRYPPQGRRVAPEVEVSDLQGPEVWVD